MNKLLGYRRRSMSSKKPTYTTKPAPASTSSSQSTMPRPQHQKHKPSHSSSSTTSSHQNHHHHPANTHHHHSPSNSTSTSPTSSRSSSASNMNLEPAPHVAEWCHQMHLIQNKKYDWCHGCHPRVILAAAHPSSLEDGDGDGMCREKEKGDKRVSWEGESQREQRDRMVTARRRGNEPGHAYQ
jgi:hypothetical protein